MESLRGLALIGIRLSACGQLKSISFIRATLPSTGQSLQLQPTGNGKDTITDCSGDQIYVSNLMFGWGISMHCLLQMNIIQSPSPSLNTASDCRTHPVF